MKDLYEILGVSKDATDKEIKKAFRTLSKKHHPDAGGETEKFQELLYAYEILSDGEKRGKYDRGESLNNVEQSRDKFIRDRLVGMFMALVSQGVKAGELDIFEHLSGNLKAAIRQIPNQERKLRMDITRFKDITRRINGDNGEIFIKTLESHIEALKAALKAIPEEKKVLSEMIDYLKEVSYELDDKDSIESQMNQLQWAFARGFK